MGSKFYGLIIDDEKKAFDIKDNALKPAAIAVARAYSRTALNKGSTYLDYNNPAYRCAYLYKYATIHTVLVTKYFRRLAKQKEVKKLLQVKQNIKVCCLGGGPGTDIVGIFKAVSLMPHYHKKIVEVTVLDICGGWRNSFKRVISGLCKGEIEKIPAAFVDSSNFKANLIAVDLLSPLPADVAKIISDADIICMVKFVSAILGKPSSIEALKNIGEKFKSDAIVFFLDNLQGNVSKPFEVISKQVGLQIVLGPLDVKFPDRKDTSPKKFHVNFPDAKKKLFGCPALCGTSVSIIGFKKGLECVQNFICLDSSSVNFDNENRDDSWDTESENEESSAIWCHPQPVIQCQKENIVQTLFCDKYTQTEVTYLNYQQRERETTFVSEDDLKTLLLSLNKLVDVVSKVQKLVAL